MKCMHSLLAWLYRSSIVCYAAVLAVTLACNSSGFCGEIHDAAKNGDLERVKVLLKDNPELVNTKDRDGETHLHEAGLNGHIDVVRLLLANGADVNAKDDKGNTPLHWAAMLGHQDVSELLLENKADVNIHEAAASGFLEKIKALIKDHPDLVSSKDQLGETPLHYAADHGYINVVRLLLDNGADVNARSKDDEVLSLNGLVKVGGLTPLHCAAIEGHKEVVELLLANKADVNALSNDGTTPLQWALQKGHQDVAELLRHHSDLETVNALLKGNPDFLFSKDKDGETPLHSAAMRGYIDVAELLLAKTNAVNVLDASGKTPLIIAAEYGEYEMVDFLVKNGADKSAKSNEGKTALDYANGKLGLRGLKIDKINENTVRIEDGFLYQSNMKFGNPMKINITGIKDGGMETEGVVPSRGQSAIGMTWVFTKPNLALPNGDYIYTSLTNGASIEFTDNGAILKCFKIENPHDKRLQQVIRTLSPVAPLMPAGQFATSHYILILGILCGVAIFSFFYLRLNRNKHE